MATFTRSTVVTNNISSLPNQPTISAAALKAKFDQYGADNNPYINNTLLPELESITDGLSGADRIGATPVGIGIANTVQGVLEELGTSDVNNVKIIGNQTIDGIKTFTSSPVVPTPTTQFQASTKKYVDDTAANFVLGVLSPSSVTTSMLQNDCVTQDKIAENAVGSNQIANGSVGYSELSNGINGRLAMTDKAIAELLMIADIDSKVFSNNLNKFYTNFSSTMDYSMGNIDNTKQQYGGSLSSGSSSVVVNSSTGFVQGQEISIQDALNYEDVILLSVVGNTLNFKTNLVNSYTNPLIYRSNNNSNSFGNIPGSPIPANSVVGFHFDGNANDFVASKSPDSNTGTFDTSNKKFGTASINYNGSQFTQYSDSADFDFGANNFYIEFWAQRNAIGTLQYVFGQADSSASGASTSCFFQFSATNIPSFGVYSGGINTSVSATTAITSTSVFNHYRIGRDVNFLRIWVNGTLEGSIAFASTINNSSNKFCIGQLGEFTSNRYNGKVDEFLIVKGVSPGSSNFTPPIKAYGDPETLFTKNVIRMNVVPYEPVKYISAWLTKTELAGFTADGKVSIVANGVDESYVDLAETTTDLGATNEVMMIGNVLTANSKVTLKIELNRASTSDIVSFTKLVGGVSS